MNNRPKILVIEDNQVTSKTLVVFLESENYSVECAFTGRDAIAAFHQGSFDLVMLDLMLPDMDGIQVCKQIRSESDLPIVMLTGRGDETDKIVGLEVGADDYLLKPFNPRELVARIRAVLRRYGKSEGPIPLPDDNTRLAFGRLTVDQKRRILFDELGKEIPLTNAEYRLLDGAGNLLPGRSQGRHAYRRGRGGTALQDRVPDPECGFPAGCG